MNERIQRKFRQFIPLLLALLALVVFTGWYLCRPQESHLDAHARVIDIAFSPDGRLLANSVEGLTIQLWDVPNQRLLRTFPGVPSFSWGPDGQQLATRTADGTIHIWNVADGQEVRRLPSMGRVTDVEWSPNGTFFAVVQQSGTVQIIQSSDGRLLQTIQASVASDFIVWSPDSTLIAIVGERSVIQLWRIADGKLVQAFRPSPTGAILTISISHDGKLLAAGVKEQIDVWQIETGHLVYRLTGHTEYVSALDFSPDDRWLVSAAGFFLEGTVTDKTVRLWAINTGQQVAILGEHDSIVTCVAFDADGYTIASGSYDRTIRLWSIRSIIETQRAKS